MTVNYNNAVTKYDALVEAINQLGMSAELGGIAYALCGESDGTQIYVEGLDTLSKYGRTDSDRRNILRGLVYKAVRNVCAAIETHTEQWPYKEDSKLAHKAHARAIAVRAAYNTL